MEPSTLPISPATTTAMSFSTRTPSFGSRHYRQRCHLSTQIVSISAAEKVIDDDSLFKQNLIRPLAKPLFRFKLVCTKWFTLISDPHVLS
ncbi:hypothetical protein LOK49_LG04G00714 [Camellia lanceoleosa]|uniref:Uncharacterized protein n=1 Tax=Camellia lanceoleosa TaxID=1840588 RepID=A0ACC0I154_9ERIC|nr:hypothetical protein LOK49_LG04G00714 [Camellia lanceoleosa]